MKRLFLTLAVLALTTTAIGAEYTEKTAYKVEVLEDGQMQIRRADIVLKDGVEISRTYHRHVLAPGNDTTKETDRIKAVAGAVWTEQVIADYEESLEASKEALN